MRVLKMSGKGALVTAKWKTQATQAFESMVKRSVGNSKGNASNTSTWDLLSVFVTVFLKNASKINFPDQMRAAQSVGQTYASAMLALNARSSMRKATCCPSMVSWT
jgi:hypothetical protein